MNTMCVQSAAYYGISEQKGEANRVQAVRMPMDTVLSQLTTDAMRLCDQKRATLKTLLNAGQS